MSTLMTQESKLTEDSLLVSTTPLHEPTTITSNPSSSNENLHQVISCPSLSWKYVKKYRKVVKLYTGCPTGAESDFIINCLKPKHGRIQYFKWNEMETIKRYQFGPSKPLCQEKPGPKQQVRSDDEVMLVLMPIRLDYPTEDSAFQCKIFAGYESKIFTTIITFLAEKLKQFVYWSTPEQTLSYKHSHFSLDYRKVEGIGDCTEQCIYRSLTPKAQYQTYSTYKNYNTVKKLVICTNIATRFTLGYSVLIDKVFNVQDLFL